MMEADSNPLDAFFKHMASTSKCIKEVVSYMSKKAVINANKVEFF